jgi:hypothetical protein
MVQNHLLFFSLILINFNELEHSMTPEEIEARVAAWTKFGLSPETIAKKKARLTQSEDGVRDIVGVEEKVEFLSVELDRLRFEKDKEVLELKRAAVKMRLIQIKNAKAQRARDRSLRINQDVIATRVGLLPSTNQFRESRQLQLQQPHPRQRQLPPPQRQCTRNGCSGTHFSPTGVESPCRFLGPHGAKPVP